MPRAKAAPSVAPAPQRSGGGGATALLVVLLIAAVGGFIWSFVNYKEASQQIAFLSTREGQVELQEQEVSELLQQVQRHIILPQNEEPVVATIVDAASLKQQQAFYADAINDDRLLIYQDKAIIYSPSRDIIVNVGPVFIQDGDQLVAPSDTQPSPALDVQPEPEPEPTPEEAPTEEPAPEESES